MNTKNVMLNGRLDVKTQKSRLNMELNVLKCTANKNQKASKIRLLKFLIFQT